MSLENKKQLTAFSNLEIILQFMKTGVLTEIQGYFGNMLLKYHVMLDDCLKVSNFVSSCEWLITEILRLYQSLVYRKILRKFKVSNLKFHLQRPSYTQGTRIYVQTAVLDLILNMLRQWQCAPDESHIGRFGTDDGPRKRWAGICTSLNIISWRKVIFVKLSIPTFIKKVSACYET